ncbi:PREDICTED: uncharacterized protein LOC108559311 [Nicrophorus vespilloides]|uniref:Uncharacterized protein LOC108559311 n=1 Tax=Nicrophorus vespilloides TaxID=110193 RepID=A0ABM1MBU0_NICVS|nr:PREDICTED: uncharacterized protein LOC108559311 [Nicrophorus vespilloides]
MYAAAGGASLASRQARQRQRQNKKAAAQKASKATDLIPKPPQKGQFYNYTDETVPKLSRVERNVLRPPHPHHPPHERRHSTSNYHLKEPKARIRESPSICIPVQNHHQPSHHHQQKQPLTPSTLPNHLPLPQSPTLGSHHLPQIVPPEEGDKTLERRCSFVRQVEEMEKFPEGGTGVLDRCNHMCNFEIKDKGWENNPAFYSEYDRSLFGSLDYPFSECSQGRAAWQERERGRRCSLSEEARQHRLKQNEAHHRWMKRNRIHDTTYGGSSDDDDFFDAYHQSAAANALLYVGLGTTAIGSVIFFVGTGEKGFKTLELRLIGPTLIACGLLCCLIRVLLCACPSNCFRRRKKTRLKNECPHNSSRYPLTRDRSVTKRTGNVAPSTSLLSQSTAIDKHKKKVSIVTNNPSSSDPHPNPVPSTSSGNFQEERVGLIQKRKQEEMQTGEASGISQTLIPIITIPDQDYFEMNERRRRMSREDSLIELENLDIIASYELQSVSSVESETVIEVDCHPKETKHTRTREPALLSALDGPSHHQTETSLSVVIERADDNSDRNPRKDEASAGSERREAHSGIVLSPLQLGQ